MRLFLVFFLLSYGGMNAYVAHAQVRALGLRGSRHRWWFYAWACLATALPILVNLGEGNGAWRVPLTWIALTWMGLVLWAVAVFLCVDLWNLAVATLSLPRGTRGLRRLLLRAPSRAVTVGCVLLVLAVWGTAESLAVRLVDHQIPVRSLPEGVDSVRLVQVTDIHWGRILRMGLARRIIGRVRQARPDILVSTGDLIDSPHPEVSALLATLGEVATPLGKFAVIGNHEVYSGTSESERMLQEAGFEVLRGKGAEPVPGLWIWGVDDPAVGHRDGGNGFVDESSLPELPQDQGFLVLLKHQPTVTAEAASRCDLQLSGHTHKGQIFPFGLLVRLIYPYPHGRLVELSERLNLYVSPGAGTWGPPFRFLARPEVTVFELVREPLMTRPTP